MIQLFKPFFQQVKCFRWWIVCGFFLVVITGAAGIALLGLAGWFISAAAFSGLSALTAAQFNYLLPSAGVRLFAYLRIVARYGERLINHEAVFRLISSLRLWLYSHLTVLSPLQLSFIKNGELLNRFMSDIGVLDNIFLRIITPFFSTLILIILTTFFLCFLNVSVGIMTFIIVMLLFLLLSFIMLISGRQASNIYQRTLNQLRDLVTQTTQALREIILFNVTNIQTQLLDKELDAMSDAQMQLSKKNSMAQAILTSSIGILVVMAVLLTVIATEKEHFSGANIAVVFLVILALGELLQPIIAAFFSVGQAEQAAKNINDVMALKPNFIAPVCEAFNLEQTSYVLNICKLTFRYCETGTLVFKDFDLTIPAAQHLVLIGQSGAGKTTVLNLIARFITAPTGSITINNCDINTLTDLQWQSIFCIVPQNPYLFDTTVRENLLLVNPQATDDMCWQALDICQMKSFIASLPQGLDTYVGQNGEHLSGGQAKRIALARAVLKNAPITLLDEPTEGLDHATEIALMHAMRDFFKNKTLVVVSHRAAVIALFQTSQMLHALIC